MVYGRRSYRSSRGRRNGSRRYARKGRGRFARKRFVKYSSKQSTKVSATVNARELFVKLPYMSFDRNITIAANGSHFQSFMGNSLCPEPIGTAAFPAAGTQWCSGATEYGNFYNQYRVLASSIKIQVLLQTSVGATCGVCLIPITAGATETGTSGNVIDRINELNTYPYEQIANLPYAQCKIIGIGNSGNSTVFMKMFRKAKHMLAVKDLRDTPATLLRLPDPDGRNGQWLNTDYGFFYYLRVFNFATGSASVIDIQVKMKFYTNLSGRTPWTPTYVPT